MSDELKSLYAKEGKADRYFDNQTPCDLWRAQSRNDFKKEVFILQPHPGYTKHDERGNVIKERLPDVKTELRDGKIFVLGYFSLKPRRVNFAILIHFSGVDNEMSL